MPPAKQYRMSQSTGIEYGKGAGRNPVPFSLDAQCACKGGFFRRVRTLARWQTELPEGHRQAARASWTPPAPIARRFSVFHGLAVVLPYAVWNSYQNKPESERKKDVIRFYEWFCTYKTWPYDNEFEINDRMRSVLYAAAHFESGSCSVLPPGFSELLGYQTDNYLSERSGGKLDADEIFDHIGRFAPLYPLSSFS